MCLHLCLDGKKDKNNKDQEAVEIKFYIPIKTEGRECHDDLLSVLSQKDRDYFIGHYLRLSVMLREHQKNKLRKVKLYRMTIIIYNIKLFILLNNKYYYR